jgi:hypothetical protein
MTHDEAKKSNAAEAYILGQLTPDERDAFEEHFFDCTDCTADVRDDARIAGGVRTGVRVVPVRHYSRWAAAAAGAMVAIGLAYQYVPQVAGLRSHRPNPTSQAAAIPGQRIELDTARAGQAKYVIVGKQSVAIDFDIQVDDPHPPYVCELRDDAGRLLASKTVTRNDDLSHAVSLDVPPDTLHSGVGNYTLGIRGDREIPPYHFVVEVQ